MVTEKIRKLHGRLTKISAGYAVFQRRENTDLVRQNLAPVQEFVTWMMQDNPLCLDGELVRTQRAVLRLAEGRVNFFGPAGCSPNATARPSPAVPAGV